MIRRGIGVQSFVSAGVSTDADAQAFITAAGITDATQRSAINTLVTDLKSYGIWTKMKAIWPFVGGTSSSHKWNLKDPRDLDAAYRLVFSGGGTHSSTGYQPNGVNGYGDTFLNVNTTLNTDNTSIAYYSRTNDYSFALMGCVEAASPDRGILLSPKFSSSFNNDFSCVNSSTVSKTAAINTNGLFIVSRIVNNQFKGYQNNSIAYTSATNSGIKPNLKIYIGARNNSGNIASQFTNLQCAFASIGDGLTDTDAANLYTAVQAYQTSLNRQV